MGDVKHRHNKGKEGKFRGPHTTYTDFAAEIADILVPLKEVIGIAPGILKRGNGMRKVQIEDFSGGLLLTVHQTRSMQELRVYGTNISSTKLFIARTLRDQKIPISFRH